MMTLRSAPHHTIFARRSRNNTKTEVDSFDPFVTLKFRLVNMINVIQEAVLSEEEEDAKCDRPLINNNGKMVNVVALSSTPTSTTSCPGMMAPELSEYYRLCLSSHGRQSIQQWFNAEYNTAAKAVELQTYYAHRPNLGQYTIDTEVPRLDYTVVYRGHVVTSSSSTTDQKYRVQQMFRDAMASSTTATTTSTTPTTATTSGHHGSTTARALCVRCANQSLLADVLQVLTGRDRWIRPQLGMAAVAKTCHFYVDLDAAVVQVSATLELSSSLAMMMSPAMADATMNVSSNDKTNGGAGRRCRVAEMEVVVKWTAAVVNCTVVDIRLL
jgi:hypothetical protein